MAMPPFILLEHCGGDYAAYQDLVYAKFCGDFCNCAPPEFEGRRFLIDRTPVAGKCARFWHLITTGPIEDERVPDLRRCERIAWVRYMIDNRLTGEFAHWHAPQRRLLIATRDFEYLVVLGDQKKVVVLITSFVVERQHARDQLRRQYEQAEKRLT